MSKRVPASIRNKNPGAQYPGAVSKRFGSTTYETLKSKDGVHKIATFPTDAQGAAAMFYLLASPAYADGKRTVREAITKWCGGYYVSTYLTVLEKKAGVTADTVLTRGMVCNPDIAIPLAQAMALQEAGQAYPMGDDEWAQAHTLALPTAALEAVAAVDPPAAVAPSPTNELPLSKPETRIAEAAKESWTIWGAITAGGSFMLAKVEAAYEVLSSGFDMAQTVAGAKTPLGLVASAAKVSTIELLGCMTIGGIIIIISRRFTAASEGKPG